MSVVIIDGISGSGKSRLLVGLQRLAQQRTPTYTKLFLTEHMTERFFERVNPSIPEVHAHVARLLRVVAEMEAIRAAGPFAQHDRILTMTLERLFLTLMSRGLMTMDFFAEEGELISATRMRHIFLMIPQGLIKDRIARSLLHRTKAWVDYVESLGGLTGAVTHFATQQEVMAEANARLPNTIERMTLEVSELTNLDDETLLEGLLWSHRSLS